eukprot:CAMPEP_0198650484 /NCGR_PEP_ID=MMETSP1467-20131203/5010_1 /TAXON_ID=1462469 /ORGANISM="unid. sp., Strain CCMP2135" /LENGTH=32 /DNA_ID= /DNA_START= /DNA_END= /DNA_ORIENTATION=
MRQHRESCRPCARDQRDPRTLRVAPHRLRQLR